MTGRVLLTGASGYIGDLLREELESRGVPLRCMTRDPESLAPRTAPETETIRGDVLEPETLPRALRGIETAYYLIHSMGAGEAYEELDRRGARNFGAAAREAGTRRIVYLGGLGEGDDLSRHLRSRQEVGRILRESGVPTLELRASVILGSGSLSFEMIRALVERLPVMVTPRWVRTPTQPIAAEDVLGYLAEALDREPGAGGGSAVYEIGGARPVTYRQIMEAYAGARGLRRWMIPVRLLTPRLSSLWLALVTPAHASVGRELVEGLRNPTVVRDHRALRDFGVEPLGVDEAIRRALAREKRAMAGMGEKEVVGRAPRADRASASRPGLCFVDSRVAEVPASPTAAYRPIRRIGGSTGWYFADLLWRLRGLLDRAAGGVGSRRGRRDPERLEAGDVVDFWRVEAVEEPRFLRLRAEMRLPGRAWLHFEVEDVTEDGGEPRSRIRQTAIFDPLGLGGRLYWHALHPIHAIIFRGMLRGIARRVGGG